MPTDDFEGNLGISRRTLIKRSAILGGTAIWVAPVVQSFAAPAFAVGSGVCDVRIIVRSGAFCYLIATAHSTAECCSCVSNNNGDLSFCDCPLSDIVQVPVQVVTCP